MEITWTLNTESDLARHELFFLTSPRSERPYPDSITIRNPSADSWVLPLSPGTYYFAL